MYIKRLRSFLVVAAALSVVAVGMQSAGAASEGSAAAGQKPVSPEKRYGSTKPSAPKVAGTAIYDSVPSPLPPNYVSLGYQATQTAEFGDLVSFAGTSRRLQSVTVGMSDWAKHSDYPSMGATWPHPITLKIYAVNNSGPTPVPGLLLASKTATFNIPWRPEPDPACTGPDAGKWMSGGVCYSGFAFTISFDFSSSTVVLPNQVIYGIGYNTNTWPGTDR